ncbi:hypothetical protein RCL1_003045 [Eukaryota sp. TZLM3-RCL]
MSLSTLSGDCSQINFQQVQGTVQVSRALVIDTAMIKFSLSCCNNDYYETLASARRQIQSPSFYIEPTPCSSSVETYENIIRSTIGKTLDNSDITVAVKHSVGSEYNITLHYRAMVDNYRYTVSLPFVFDFTPISRSRLGFLCDTNGLAYFLPTVHWHNPAHVFARNKIHKASQFLDDVLPSSMEYSLLRFRRDLERSNSGSMCRVVSEFIVTVTSNEFSEVVSFSLNLESRATRIVTFWIFLILIALLLHCLLLLKGRIDLEHSTVDFEKFSLGFLLAVLFSAVVTIVFLFHLQSFFYCKMSTLIT